ncbi:MAG: hypothetical protein EXS35_08785 [Pedosphaera sp.]|nr:hypothetical protein [Pedosphaera sp.]
MRRKNCGGNSFKGSTANRLRFETRSGKIMRRILRKIAENQTDQIGDTTTLADPGVVDSLVKGKQ